MPTYDYLLETGETIQVPQRITDDALKTIFHDGRFLACKRLITGAPAVHFIEGPSGGWANTGYSKREHERQAEATLGRKLIKSAR